MGTWQVLRNGGGRTDRPRVVYAGGEAEARAGFARERAAMRQGSVTLLDPDGQRADYAWAPRLRTRW